MKSRDCWRTRRPYHISVILNRKLTLAVTGWDGVLSWIEWSRRLAKWLVADRGNFRSFRLESEELCLGQDTLATSWLSHGELPMASKGTLVTQEDSDIQAENDIYAWQCHNTSCLNMKRMFCFTEIYDSGGGV